MRDVLLFVLAWVGLQFVIVLGLNFLSPVVPGLGQVLDSLTNGKDITAAFVFNLIDAAIGLGVVWLILRKYKVGWSSLGWRKTNLVRAIFYLVGILAFFIIAASMLLWLVSWLVPNFNPNQAQNNEFVDAAGTHINMAVIALILLPPVLEETIFRGFLFPAMAKRLGVGWGAVASAAVFGLAHGQANVSIYTFVLGLLLCFMYVRLRSIVPGIALHMLNNYLAFIAYTSK